ncbi:two pore domain potassium channel family protein [Nocardioides mangrovicus]|uniref:Two pore domain potassium channel family protein n=1 Tax=Nocardioides mangrovicus TaxID=2478913 RepID=A0A3L8P4D7_9ACTN|nr:potassium channel family protein [Nocardioides mangrovicus]RLV50270.1 two pore domain potassium channel family protein [Nocardioides mangrovicus]
MEAEPARSAWERLSDAPLTITALAFLVAYAWPILEPAIRSDAVGAACSVVTWVAWVMFAVDYVARLVLSRDRAGFVRGNVVDLVVVAVPIFRPLRLLRLLTVLKVINRRAELSLGNRVAIYGLGAASLLVFVSALAMLDAERGATTANIRNFGDALWWALATITTTGYGDKYPVTTTGRFVAAGLMIAGMALLAVVTASFANWLLSHLSSIDRAEQTETRRDLERVLSELQQVRQRLASIEPDEHAPPPP